MLVRTVSPLLRFAPSPELCKELAPAGRLVVICGPVRSSKTEELMRLISVAKYAERKASIFKHPINNDFCNLLSSRGRLKEEINAQSINDASHVIESVKSHQSDLVAVDEVHLFASDMNEAIEKLIEQGVEVLVAGLDQHFKKPYGECMPYLLSIADEVHKLAAICTSCKADATLSQCFIDDNPATEPITDNKIHKVEFKPYCRNCHITAQVVDFTPLPKLRKEFMSACRLVVICGPMCSGKTDKLMQLITRAKYAELRTMVFKHAFDTRSTDLLVSRSREHEEIPAIPIRNAAPMIEAIRAQIPDIVAIDEVQFFDKDMGDAISMLIEHGIQVLVSGLDKNFRRQPFGECMPHLLSVADQVQKLPASCRVCNTHNATLSQRLVDGKPSHKSDPLVIIDDGKSNVEYQPRCRRCHALPE